jgi:RNA polymerase sigma-70 factor (ECF subfamily)
MDGLPRAGQRFAAGVHLMDIGDRTRARRCMSESDDRVLTERFVADGDEEAFRLLYRRHTPRLYAVAVRLSGGRNADADDVVQEAWVRAARRLSSFEWRSALPTWLTSIVVRCGLERLRARRPDRNVPLDAVAASMAVRATDPAVALDLEAAIASLPDGYRVAVVLHDIEGWSHAEIARTLGIAEGTARSQLFHARRQLRATLSGATPSSINGD